MAMNGSRDHLRLDLGDQLTARGLACDARAVTRGDIMANDEFGYTVYPRYAKKARGAYIWDVDGNRYIDYLLGYGPVVLGHADARVTEAVIAELANGTCLTPLWSPLQVELTELLTSILPGAELAYLMKTGSEANSAAVRLARIFTGRSKVVRWGYNGWHDWAVTQPAGIPVGTRAETLLFDASPDALASLFQRYPNQIAAVLMMPFEFETVDPARLRAIRQLAHDHHALLIFDEIRSGFRLRLGGAQEFLGVQADLATFSKAIANGYPVSALAGRREIMQGLAETKVSSSFYANPADMAAALTTISILSKTDVIDTLWSIGGALQNGLRTLIARYTVPAEVVGYPPIPFMRFLHASPLARGRAERLFFRETTRRGILLHPHHQWFVSAAHTNDDVEATLDACEHAFRLVAQAVD
jgi:glutamate-1-semialdehyde 2,1-aminomutase